MLVVHSEEGTQRLGLRKSLTADQSSLLTTEQPCWKSCSLMTRGSLSRTLILIFCLMSLRQSWSEKLWRCSASTANTALVQAPLAATLTHTQGQYRDLSKHYKTYHVKYTTTLRHHEIMDVQMLITVLFYIILEKQQCTHYLKNIIKQKYFDTMVCIVP